MEKNENEEKVFVENRLIEVTLSLADELDKLEPGSEEHQIIVNEMSTIGETLTKVSKVEVDNESARLQREHEEKLKKLEIIGDILKVAIPATLTFMGTVTSLVVIVEMNNINMVAEHKENIFMQSSSAKKGEFWLGKIFKPGR